MNQSYYELIITTNLNSEVMIDFLSSFVDAIEEDDNTFIVRSEEKLDILETGVREFVSQISKKIKKDIFLDTKIKELKNQDWIQNYKQSIKPIKVASFYIYPPWGYPQQGSINIELEPSFAFGSGHHNTTRSVLKSLDLYLKPKQTLLDVGCGSGILSIAAAKKGAIVSLCDTDPMAIKNSQENFLKNSVTYKDIWVGSANQVGDTYNIVVANIVADILIFISKDLKNRAQDNGILILSGIIDSRVDAVKEKFNDISLLEHIQDGEWNTLIYKKVNNE